jgi:hypothetical protein
MPKQSISYEIFIASPSDTAAERDVVSECIREWNSAHAAHGGVYCRDVRWELDSIPEFGERGQQVLNDQLVDRADIVIGIFKSRLGKPTGVAQSGTVEEIQRFVAANKPAMLYFSTGNIPRDHDPEQLALVRKYERSVSGKAIYKPFSDEHDLRRKVTHDLSAMMARIVNAPPAHPQQSDLARVFIRTRPGERSGDVRTVRVSAVIENISANRKIKDYVCTLSIPKACLTHSSAVIMDEMRQETPSNYRLFRRSNDNPGIPSIIFQGDKVPVFALDIGVDQLLMKGTYLAGDYEGTLADKVTVKAVVEGLILEAERSVADIFANQNQG